MEEPKSLEVFEKAPVRKAVLQNALPAMAAMLMVLIYNLADIFFIGQTHDDLQAAAVSLATPVFLLFMAVGRSLALLCLPCSCFLLSGSLPLLEQAQIHGCMQKLILPSSALRGRLS